MVFSINKSVNENNINSAKLYFNGQIPDWGNGANTESDGRRVVNLPADDTFGFNFLKISTYQSVHTNYTIKIFSCPPIVPSRDLAFDSNGLYKVEDLSNTTINHIDTKTPIYTELLTGNKYHYRVIPVMGEFMRIEFEYNGAYDARSDKTDGNSGHLYCKTLLSRDATGSVFVDTIN
tara:strand:- start:2264 stop:2794 length:531 start_codon:yes stop_codon:yes gene_type:complete